MAPRVYEPRSATTAAAQGHLTFRPPRRNMRTLLRAGAAGKSSWGLSGGRTGGELGFSGFTHTPLRVYFLQGAKYMISSSLKITLILFRIF